MSNAELSNIAEQVEDPQEPDDYGDYHHSVQNSFDLALHGYEPIYQP
jgi:hypothetical protein